MVWKGDVTTLASPFNENSDWKAFCAHCKLWHNPVGNLRMAFMRDLLSDEDVWTALRGHLEWHEDKLWAFVVVAICVLGHFGTVTVTRMLFICFRMVCTYLSGAWQFREVDSCEWRCGRRAFCQVLVQSFWVRWVFFSGRQSWILVGGEERSRLI